VWLPPYIRGRAAWRDARAALDDRDFVRARECLERCLAISPQDPAAHFELARTLRRAGQAEEAARRLDRAEQLGQPFPAVELERLLAQAQAGYMRPLEEGLDRIGYAPEDDPLIREALVVGYLQGHFLDRAFQVSSRWVADRPEDWQGHYWQGRVLQSGLQF